MTEINNEEIRSAIDGVLSEVIGTLVDAPPPTGTCDLGETLLGLGFTPDAAASFRGVCRRAFAAGPAGPAAPDALEAMIAAMLDTPSPDAALRNLERYLDRIGDPGVFLSTVVPAPPILEMVAVVFGTSQYMADILVRNPTLVYWLMEQRTWDHLDDVAQYTEWFAREASLFSGEEARLDAVRRAHRQALLRIGVLDLLGHASVEDTTARLSALADALVRVVLNIVRTSLSETVDSAPDDLAVIAMGKLGGGELNYSSDIDLVYVCGDGSDDAVAFHTRVARRLGEAISQASGEGYLYRVDLRLRPDGHAGPLVNNETAMRLYYERRGRPWEFQALLKARVIAGDEALGRRLLDSLAALVYNPSLSYSPLESIAAMRERIRENIDAHERGFNIKLMEGGIRDIEFLTQTLQLMHTPQHPSLRTGHTVAALGHIREAGLLEDWKVEHLLGAYRFFRVIEHRLQMMHQIKTHTVPQSDEEIAMLARRVSRGPVGTFDTDAFLDALSRHLGNVRSLAAEVFAGEPVPAHAVLLMLPADDPGAQEIIREYGIEDTARAAKALHSMAYGSFPRLLDRDARRNFEQLLPHVLDGAARTGDPALTLVNLSDIAGAGRNESSFYQLLLENEPARELVLGFAGLSSYLSRRLCNQIDVLDELLEANDEMAFASQFRSLPEWDRFNPSLAKRGGEAARERQERQRTWFDRARLNDFAVNYRRGFRPFGGGRTRSFLAARQLSAAFDAVFPNPSGIALFALGSYAAEEARATSDLDLLVVTDGADLPAVTTGVQTINQWFTGSGILKLDFRLRGEGASAPLVQDISFYADYFARRVSTWERVAMAKCRPWWGDKDLQQRFLSTLRDTVVAPLSGKDVQELVDVRRRIETLAPKKFRMWDTKRVAGGRYDVEYLTAVGLIETCGDDPGLLGMTTGDRLQRLTQERVLSREELAACTAALELYGVVEYLMELQEFVQPRSAEKHESLCRYLDRTFALLDLDSGHGVEKLLERNKGNVRAVYERVMTRER